jgi:hypothetical protein
MTLQSGPIPLPPFLPEEIGRKQLDDNGEYKEIVVLLLCPVASAPVSKASCACFVVPLLTGGRF